MADPIYKNAFARQNVVFLEPSASWKSTFSNGGGQMVYVFVEDDGSGVDRLVFNTCSSAGPNKYSLNYFGMIYPAGAEGRQYWMDRDVDTDVMPIILGGYLRTNSANIVEVTGDLTAGTLLYISDSSSPGYKGKLTNTPPSSAASYSKVAPVAMVIQDQIDVEPVLIYLFYNDFYKGASVLSKTSVEATTAATYHLALGEFVESARTTDQTVNLPDSSATIIPIGARCAVKKIVATGNITVSSQGTDALDGGTTDVISIQWDYVEYMWSGYRWNRVSCVASGDVLGPGSAVDNAAAVFDGTTGKLIKEADVIIDGGEVTGVDCVGFDTGAGAPSHAEGLLFWDAANYTLGLYTDVSAVTLQIGQEMWVRVKNTSGVELSNGKVCYLSGVDGTDLTAALAKADDASTCLSTLGVATHDISIGGYGYITTSGMVRDMDTDSWDPGDILYLSTATAGAMQTSIVGSPSYNVKIGTVGVKNATTGNILVGVEVGGNTQSVIGIFNGAILEDHAIDVIGETGPDRVYLTLEKTGGGDLSLFFDATFYVLDTTPAAEIDLTEGTDTVPVQNFVYIPNSTKVLTKSTSGWPAEQHTPIATAVVQSAASAETDGVLKVHAWTDHVASSDGQGHVSHVNRWIREQHATWLSGSAPTIRLGGTPITPPSDVGSGTITWASAAGVVLQLHEHTFPSFADGSDLYVVNDSVTAYDKITDISSIDTDSLGNSLNNSTFALIIWGCVSEDSDAPTTIDSKLYINLPSGGYNSAAAAREDVSGYTNYGIGSDFKGTGFLIRRLIIKRNAPGTQWTVYTEADGDDLRGQLPNNVAGTSTGTSTDFSDAVFRISDNADDTSKLAFEISPVTTSTTRTITMLDADIDLSNVVQGPASATDDALARYDGTTGKLIKDSANLTYNGTDTITLNTGVIALEHVADSVAIGENAGNVGTVTGTRNTTVGNVSGRDLTSGANNTALGWASMKVLLGGNNNTAVGYGSQENATGSSNTSLGLQSLRAVTGSFSTAVGGTALAAVTSGGGHVAVGYQAGASITSNANSTAIGYQALFVNTAAENTAVGASSLVANTDGFHNVAVGFEALSSNTTSDNSTAVGFKSLSSCTGSQNTAVGSYAGESLTSSSNCTFVGYQAGRLNTAANVTAIGSLALDANTSGANNTAVGTSALSTLSTGSDCTAVGYQTLLLNTAAGNTAVGAGAGAAVTSGVGHVLIGYQAGSTFTAGGSATAVGYQALASAANASSVAVGYQAMSLATGPQNTAIGYQCLQDVTAVGNVALGYQAGLEATSGTGLTLIGNQAGDALTTETNCTAVGYQALSAAGGSDNTAVGYQVLRLATGSFNTGSGSYALAGLTTGGNNVAMGYGSMRATTASNSCAAVGYQSLGSATGSSNCAVGRDALRYSTGNNNSAVGYQSGVAVTSGTNCTFIGVTAGAGITTTSNNVAVGAQALSVSAGASNTTAIGFKALAATTAAGNVGVGYEAGALLTSGTQTTLVGYQSGNALTTEIDNTALGYQTLGGAGVTKCVAIGSLALQSATGASNVAIGHKTLPVVTGASNIAIGDRAGEVLATGGSNMLIGAFNGRALTTGAANTAVGANALISAVGASSCVAIGFQAAGNATASNMTAVGRESLKVNTGTGNTALGYQSGLTVTSGTGHVLIGYQAGDALTTEINTTAVGYQALSAAGGGSSTAVGYQAMQAATGVNNVSVGVRALADVTSDSNVGVGYFAGSVATAITQCTLVGSNTGITLTTGNANTGVGFAALSALTNQINNTAVGGSSQRSSTGAANTSVGVDALRNVTSDNNVAMGYSAGTALLGGAGHVLIGYQAGDALTTNDNCTALGYQSLSAAAGSDCTAVGYQAATLNTAAEITAIGSGALASNTSGANNTAGGYNALNANATTDDCTAFGHNALAVNTSSYASAFGSGAGASANGSGSGFFSAFGYNALTNLVGGNQCSAFGAEAGLDNVSGGNNCFFGYHSGRDTLGGTNSWFGSRSGEQAVGANNTGMGWSAGLVYTGNGSTFLGTNAADSKTAGNDCIAIGSDVEHSTNTVSDELAIGIRSDPSILMDMNASAPRMRIGGSGALTASTILDLDTTTTGALRLPSLTTTERDALTAVNSMLIYNETTSKFQGRAGGAWVDLH